MPRLRMESIPAAVPADPDFAFMDKYFTLYWLTGKREVICGPNIETAFAKAGYGGGAIHAVDWYDNKASDTHYWSAKDKKWYPRIPMPLTLHEVKQFGFTELVALFGQDHSITVTLPDKNILVLEVKYGCFVNLGVMKYIQLAMGEYCDGPYIEDSEDDHHYQLTAMEYLPATEYANAVASLIGRLHDPATPSANGKSHEEIARLGIL